MPEQGDTLQDKELLLKIKSNNREAFKVLFYRHFKALTAVGERILRDEDAGKDIAQTTFIQFWEKRDALDIQGEVFPYLKKMALNEALAQMRTTKRKSEIGEQIDFAQTTRADGEDKVIGDELKVQIDDAVDALPEKCREVFKLSRFEEMSYKEISGTLDISVKTVENHMGRALRQLRTALKHYMHVLF